MIDGEEMISPVTSAPEDTPTTIYRLNRRFYLSNGHFHWIRLNSLTPVTVLSDSRKQILCPPRFFRFLHNLYVLEICDINLSSAKML